MENAIRCWDFASVGSWLSEFLRFPFFIFLHTFLQQDLHVKGVADVSSSGLYQLALGQLKRETWPTRPHPFWIWTCHNGIDMPLLETWPLKYKELYIYISSPKAGSVHHDIWGWQFFAKMNILPWGHDAPRHDVGNTMTLCTEFLSHEQRLMVRLLRPNSAKDCDCNWCHPVHSPLDSTR